MSHNPLRCKAVFVSLGGKQRSGRLLVVNHPLSVGRDTASFFMPGQQTRNLLHFLHLHQVGRVVCDEEYDDNDLHLRFYCEQCVT